MQQFGTSGIFSQSWQRHRSQRSVKHRRLQQAASAASPCCSVPGPLLQPQAAAWRGHPAAELQSPQPSSPLCPRLRQLHPGAPRLISCCWSQPSSSTPCSLPATGSAAAQKLSLHSYTQNQSFLARVCGVIVGSAPWEGAGGFGRAVSLSPLSQPPHTAGLQPAALLSQHERCQKVLFYPKKYCHLYAAGSFAFSQCIEMNCGLVFSSVAVTGLPKEWNPFFFC